MQNSEGDLNHPSTCQQKCYFSIIQLIRMEALNNCALWKIRTDNQMNFMCKVSRKQIRAPEGTEFSSASALTLPSNYTSLTGTRAPFCSANVNCFTLVDMKVRVGSHTEFTNMNIQCVNLKNLYSSCFGTSTITALQSACGGKLSSSKQGQFLLSG